RGRGDPCRRARPGPARRASACGALRARRTGSFPRAARRGGAPGGAETAGPPTAGRIAGRLRCRRHGSTRVSGSRAAILCLMLLAAPVAQACGVGAGNAAEDETPLLVFAASDLQVAFDELVPMYESEAGERIEV